MRLGDRRKNTRFDCTHPVHYAYGDAPMRMGLLNDISIGGVLLASHEAIPDGIQITIRLRDPRAQTDIELRGHVRHRANDRAYGVAFIELSAEALELVDYLLTVAQTKAPD